MSRPGIAVLKLPFHDRADGEPLLKGHPFRARLAQHDQINASIGGLRRKTASAESTFSEAKGIRQVALRWASCRLPDHGQ